MRGSVRRRGRTWRAVVDLPRAQGEKRRQRARSFRTRGEAQAWVARTAVAMRGVAADPGRMTVGAYLEQWLEAVRCSLKPNSAATYATDVRRWQRAIGGLRLTRLAPPDIQRAVQAMAGRLDASTVRHAIAVLRAALRQGVAWGMLAADPSRGLKQPRETDRDLRCWGEAEAAAFLGAVAGRTRYAALFRLALASGMRLGELLGLRWQDVDWDLGAVRVVHSLSWPSGGQARLGAPKSRSGRRTIPLDAGTVASLRAHRRLQAGERLSAGPAWLDLGLVFPTSRGGFVRQRYVEERFNALARAAGLPRIRFHDLRHTHATILLRKGRNVREVAERLGHADPALTLRVYSHVLPGQQSGAAQAIGAALDQGV